MGHPISGSGPTEQHLPMAIQPKGAIARASQHRPSRSISSLPLEKLSKINCEKRTSMSALNSPAASPAAATRALGETEKVMKQMSFGSILGQDYSARRKGVRRGGDARNLSGAESGSESDRKPSSFNLFRGHRRVGSGSSITNKTPTWDSSPRTKLNATASTTRSATASPKKLDKYAVAKIAASLFHSPGTKLERSQSQRASSPRRVDKKRNSHALTAGEHIVPVNQPDGSPFATEESVPRSSSCSVQHMEETSVPPASETPSIQIQTHVIDDAKPEEAPEGPPPPPASTSVEDYPPCVTEHMIPSESVTLNSPVLETAAEIILEKFYPTSPEDVSAPQPCGMPDTNMEVIPDSPTVSIAALFDDTVVEEEEEEEEEEADGVDEEEGSTGAAGDINAFLQIESENSDRGDLRVSENGDFGDGSSFPTAICQVTMKETREEDGGEDLVAEKNANGDCQFDDNQSTQALLFTTEKLPTEKEELTEASVPCTISTIDGEVPIRAPSPAQEHPSPPPSSPPPPPPPFPSEDHSPDRDVPMKLPSPLEELERFPCRDLPMLRVSSSPRLMGMLLQQPQPEEPSSCKLVKVHHVVKPTLRKRRRSASGSGLSAMLLKVVRVPDEGTIVTRRFVESPEWGQMENPSGVDHGFGRENGGSGVCDSEPEDAVKSTYSKFVDIEIDPGHGCVELVQHSKDIYHDNTTNNIGWKRHPQAAFFERQFRNSPRRLPPVKINTCSVYEGKARSRKSKTIRRGRMNSYDLDTLKEYLKTTDTISALPQTNPTTETPKAKAVASPSPPPPAPPPPQAKMDSILSTRPERSRTFVSRLQAPSSGAFSYVDVDVYRPCSVSILSNPSFSSSHQDKLWEEQAEIYSSGGRGTPGREDDDDKVRAGDKAAVTAQPAPPPQTLLYNLHHSPLRPGFGSIHHDQHPGGFNPSLRRSTLGSGSLRSPSESGHFMQQIMSKIRGSSPKRVSSSATTIATRAPGSYPTPQLEISRKRNAWSSCICFSVKS